MPRVHIGFNTVYTRALTPDQKNMVCVTTNVCPNDQIRYTDQLLLINYSRHGDQLKP